MKSSARRGRRVGKKRRQISRGKAPTTPNLASVLVVIYGLVQGVFFRDFISRRAIELGLSGYVRNLPDGRALEVAAEGERVKLQRLIEHLKTGPPGAIVSRIATNWSDYSGQYSRFSVRY